jgi:hypothetical protein
LAAATYLLAFAISFAARCSASSTFNLASASAYFTYSSASFSLAAATLS